MVKGDKKGIYVDLQTDFNNNEFVIMGCGKHGNEKKYLTKAEASLLYVELHKFLFNNGNSK